MINPKFILSKKTTEKKDQKRGRNVSRRQFVKVATGTAAIIGLLFIIFSLLILQFIGVDVLGIFGASSGGAGGGAKVR